VEAVRLLNLIAGWHRVRTAEGVVLVPPLGPDAAAIQIFERRRPLRRMKDVLDEMIATMDRESLVRGPVERFPTLEGEYGAMTTLTTTVDGAPLVRTVAMLVGDDAYTLIDALVAYSQLDDHVTQLVREIATSYFLSLGGNRRRMYLYDVPAGWHGVRRAHATTYYHPDHPRHGGTIDVFDARPAAVGAADIHDRILFVDSPRIVSADPPKQPSRVVSAHGLAGGKIAMTGLDADGQQVVIHRITLTDTKFIYMVQAEATEAEMPGCLPALVQILSSIRPLPPTITKSDEGSFIHWSD
jgi:hypothetical protein